MFTLGAEPTLTPAFARATVTDVTRRGGFRETGTSCASIGFRGSHLGTERKDGAQPLLQSLDYFYKHYCGWTP